MKDKESADPLSKTTHNFNFKKAKPVSKLARHLALNEDSQEVSFSKRKGSKISTHTGYSP